MNPQILVYLFLIIVSSSLVGQVESVYENLLSTGENNILIESKNLHTASGLLDLKEGENIFSVYFNSDTTRIVFLSEKVSNYDPTNDIRNDEHNKVNFITFGAFNEKTALKYYFRAISAIYYALPDSDSIWFLHYSDADDAFPSSLKTGKLDFLKKSIPLALINNESNNLALSYWASGLFESTPDLRLDPNWDNYGKNVWVQKEKDYRPYIGYPALVRIYLEQKTDN